MKKKYLYLYLNYIWILYLLFEKLYDIFEVYFYKLLLAQYYKQKYEFAQ